MAGRCSAACHLEGVLLIKPHNMTCMLIRSQGASGHKSCLTANVQDSQETLAKLPSGVLSFQAVHCIIQLSFLIHGNLHCLILSPIKVPETGNL